MTFWDNFTRACVLNGVSPTAICKKIGLSNATATHWRQGALPKADAIAAVADLLGVSADYLLGRADLQEKSDPQISPLERRLLSAFRVLPADIQNQLLGRAELLAEQERDAQKKEA